jgi:hypothetical protein
MRKEETVTVELLHRAVPAKHIDEGLRAPRIYMAYFKRLILVPKARI